MNSNYYLKYLKYKQKYFDLKDQISYVQGGSIKQKYFDLKRGGNYEENIARINHYFSTTDLCLAEDLGIEGTRPLNPSTGATKGYGGSHLYFGNVGDIPVSIKIFLFKKLEGIDKNLNEIGLTHFISDYFMKNPKITDNITVFYTSKRCINYLDSHLRIADHINSIDEDVTKVYNCDVNVMIVEKVMGDLKGYINANKSIPTIHNILVSILFQACYTLLVFNEKFGHFYHGDFHCGNILLKEEEKEFKVYKLILDGDPYIIKLQTFKLCPKLWDFQTSYVKEINDKLLVNDHSTLTTFFRYLNTDRFLEVKGESTIDKDLQELLKSILLLFTAEEHKLSPLLLEINSRNLTGSMNTFKIKNFLLYLTDFLLPPNYAIDPDDDKFKDHPFDFTNA
jgi:hypothetical protein